MIVEVINLLQLQDYTSARMSYKYRVTSRIQIATRFFIHLHLRVGIRVFSTRRLMRMSRLEVFRFFFSLIVKRHCNIMIKIHVV